MHICFFFLRSSGGFDDPAFVFFCFFFRRINFSRLVIPASRPMPKFKVTRRMSWAETFPNDFHLWGSGDAGVFTWLVPGGETSELDSSCLWVFQSSCYSMLQPTFLRGWFPYWQLFLYLCETARVQAWHRERERERERQRAVQTCIIMHPNM